MVVMMMVFFVMFVKKAVMLFLSELCNLYKRR
jgi:hypothetical protein